MNWSKYEKDIMEMECDAVIRIAAWLRLDAICLL